MTTRTGIKLESALTDPKQAWRIPGEEDIIKYLNDVGAQIEGLASLQRSPTEDELERLEKMQRRVDRAKEIL